jgi:hypothetical protein
MMLNLDAPVSAGPTAAAGKKKSSLAELFSFKGSKVALPAASRD